MTLPAGGGAIDINGYGWTSLGTTYTEITGPLRPDVATVLVRYRRNGERKQARAAVAQVDGELLEAVREEEPFGFFEVAVRGCVEAKRFRAIALDGSGERLDLVRSDSGGRCPRRSG